MARRRWAAGAAASFVVEQLDPETVAAIAIDPTGIADGEIPDEPPNVH